MKKRRVVGVILLVLLLGSTVALGGLVETGNRIMVPSDRPVPDNLMAFGSVVEVRGVIQGDLLSTARSIVVGDSIADNMYGAAQRIRVESRIGGDAILFAQTIDQSDTVVSDLRGACQTYDQRGVVGGDLVMAAQNLTLGAGSVVGGDAYLAGQSAYIGGDIGRKLTAAVEELTIAGMVHGDVEAWSDVVRFDGGQVDGDLIYHGEDAPDPTWAGMVTGKVIHDPQDLDERTGAEKSEWPGLIYSLLAALATMVILIGFFRRLIEDAFKDFLNHPWKRGGLGLLGLIVQPAVAIIGFALVITIPVAAMLTGLYIAFLYLGWVIFATVGGTWLLGLFTGGKVRVWGGGPLGVVVLWLLAMIPVVGGVVCFLACVFGFGVLLHSLYGIFWPKRV